MEKSTTDKEMQRQEALRSYSIEYQVGEKQFNDISRLASIICDRPIALITFIDAQHQWIKSSVGLGDRNDLMRMDRSISFCGHTIGNDDVFIVEDSLCHPLFQENPLVVNDPKIRFYAGAPLITPGGQRIGALCVIDQKPGKLTEAQTEALKVLSYSIITLLELNKQNVQLAEEKQKALQAARAKGDFLSTMSHEIRTPLNGIIGITNILADEQLEDHLAEYVKTLTFSANNLMSIVNDVLDYSKIEAGGITLEQIPFNLNDLLIGIKNANQVKAHNKGIKLKLKREDDIPEFVVGDPARLSQVLNNLLSNAIKFTHHGEVTMDVSLNEVSGEHASVHFSIRDTGIDIPQDKKEFLFQKFTQLDSSITRKFGGTGLGLAITKRLLKLYRSEITCHSEPGKGSTFSFTIDFPVAPKKVNQDASGASPGKQFEHFQNPAVLLVEDNEVNTMITKTIVKKWGVQIKHATNGREALTLLERENFDLILMDLQMPVMDGYEATRAIRQTGHSMSELPIIGLSASAMESEKDQAMEAGMNDFICKPFNPMDLNRKLKENLHERFLTG